MVKRIFTEMSFREMTNLIPKYLSNTLSLYDRCGLKYSSLEAESESAEYAAYNFVLDGLAVEFRAAKITPTKTGQFVTLWKSDGNDPIMPLDSTDPIDLVVISVNKENHFGQFIFPKSALIKHKVFSHQDTEGKRAIRVYPSWDEATSSQAKKTQKWQLEFFLEISDDGKFDRDHMKKLYFAHLRSQ